MSISGERIDEDPKTEQTLKRSFSRKYSIPTDIILDSIKAHLTDFGLLLIRVSFKNALEQVSVDQFNDASSTSFPTLHNPHTFTHCLGPTEELERDRDSHRNTRGPIERRRASNGQRVQAERQCRSTPVSPTQHRRRRADPWRDECPTERAYFETTTRTSSHLYSTHSLSTLPGSTQSQAVQRVDPRKLVGSSHRLTHLDSETDTSFEESLV